MNLVPASLARPLGAGLLAAVTAATAIATAAMAQPQTPAPSAAPPASFGICAACHETTAGAHPSLGPNLLNVGGRKAGSAPDFDYSDALKASSTVWTADTLQAFILDPAKAIPGNKMDYPGAGDAATAKEIADYLMSLKG
ncbi:c-type cytochrome [Phenylobacterium sp.]|jgi:cytochrome c|uniref:c-type cytochrome n=1 Tax=Phenylobacterium sp. TaxID=1871053 RepID=UPI002F42D41B